MKLLDILKNPYAVKNPYVVRVNRTRMISVVSLITKRSEKEREADKC